MLSGTVTCLLWLQVVASMPRATQSDGDLDPDSQRNASELIASKGYPVEEHDVLTTDGFILMVQRIPHGKNAVPSAGPKKAVLVIHGLLSSSADWVINFPEQSLGFILADAGYDVWLGNVRGNTYSRHKDYTRKDKEFWDFSFDEMIKYDLPALLDYVSNATGEERLHYIGHSQGTLLMFGLLSRQQEYNEKLRLFSALAPVVTLVGARTPLLWLAPVAWNITNAMERRGRYDFLPNDDFIKSMATTTCRYLVSRALCGSFIFLTTGINLKQLNKSRLHVYMSHAPAGTSTKNMRHYAQLYEQKRLQMFDYGPNGNRLAYGQARPPKYDVSKVTAPVSIFWSQNDWFVHPDQIVKLRSLLPNVVHVYEVPDTMFTHLDFLTGIGANDVVYKDLLSVMERY